MNKSVCKKYLQRVLIILFSLACQRGFFGENCIKKCKDNCAGCNDVSGLCEYGCLEGYTGYFCENGDFNFSYSLETHVFTINCLLLNDIGDYM